MTASYLASRSRTEYLEKYKTQMRVLVDGAPVSFNVENNKLNVTMPKRQDGKARDVVLQLRLGQIPVLGHATYLYTAAQ
jgi:hypothetical protein